MNNCANNALIIVFPGYCVRQKLFVTCLFGIFLLPLHREKKEIKI